MLLIFTIMIPSFLLALIPEFIVLHVFGIVSIVTLIHVPFGVLAVSLGLWFVISWSFHGLKGCFKRKRLMLTTMIAWLTSLFFGMVLYIIFYVPLLMS